MVKLTYLSSTQLPLQFFIFCCVLLIMLLLLCWLEEGGEEETSEGIEIGEAHKSTLFAGILTCIHPSVVAEEEERRERGE